MVDINRVLTSLLSLLLVVMNLFECIEFYWNKSIYLHRLVATDQSQCAIIQNHII